MIKAVIFDMDGVMTDSEDLINEAAIAGLREYGIEPQPDDFLPFLGMGEDRYIGGVAWKYGLTYAPEMKARVYEIYFGLIPGRLKAFPGVPDLLEQLRGKAECLALNVISKLIKPWWLTGASLMFT